MKQNKDMQKIISAEIGRDNVFVFDEIFRQYEGAEIGIYARPSANKKSYDIYILKKTDLTINDEHLGIVDIVEAKLSLSKAQVQLLTMAFNHGVKFLEGPDYTEDLL